MNLLCGLAIFLGCLSLGESYSKYGRSCKDIGCPSNEVCVMENDPCSYYQRENECGAYPTCKKMSSNTQRTCATYVCPPSQVCKMDGDHPKCVNDASKSGHVRYDTHSANAPLGDPGAGGSNAPNGGNLYPTIPRGETTPRPNVQRPQVGGGGYQGGQIGSGYPGQSRPAQYPGGYPQQTGGYQQPGGYPGYSGAGYPGYPQGGYQGGNQGGYQGGYQQPYPGYNAGQNNQNPYQHQQRYGQNSGQSSSFTDKIASSLKSIGTDLLKSYIQKAITGNRN